VKTELNDADFLGLMKTVVKAKDYADIRPEGKTPLPASRSTERQCKIIRNQI